MMNIFLFTFDDGDICLIGRKYRDGEVYWGSYDYYRDILVYKVPKISVSNVFCETIMYNEERYANRGDQRKCSQRIFLNNGFLKALSIL